ncbi:Hypothetical_protein [Hexamita inflata]|uniref:Hypothetical_protein n=1 Tax=Hexamita inflata TaxID=28002 RepID=A0AA86PQP3_9EUKA|nr:Hypothetical protein HINF_LOCUS31551 [Hexamita inflata]
MLSRARQHGSTTIDEYIGTICLAATLRKKPHLSFHRKLSLKLSCFHPPSERAHSLPLARFRRLFLGPLVLRLNCLSFESLPDGKQNPRVYSAGPTEALCTFPFLSHPRRGCCRLFLRAAVVSIGGGVEWESAAFHSANIFVLSLEMESEQQCPESVSQRLAFGTDVSGSSTPDPVVFEKRVPSRLRESRIIFRCFRLARPLDFSNESQTCPRMLSRARQHGSTTIDEYIGTICLAATLRKKPHLSFHRKLSLKLSCFHPPSERAHSLPLARFRRLFLGPLVLRLNCLSFESLPDGKQNPRVYSAGPTEALCTFPFLSHPRRGCCRLFLRAAVVSIGGGVEWESAAFHSANIFVLSLEMESEQQCPESVSQRLAFGTDVSGCSTPDPAVFEKRVPSRLRESRIIFRCFRLARPLDFSNESQTCPRMLSRARQHGSTTIDEYIGTICLAATLRKKPHLSFHRKLSLKLSCFHPPSERAHSLPLARFRRLFLGPLVLRLNCLSFESLPDGKQNPRVYSADPPEARRTFPFLSHPRRGCCRLFLRASVVSIGGGVEWESAAFHSANIFVLSLEMESEQQCPESVSQRLAFGTDVSGCSTPDPAVFEKRVPSRLRESRIICRCFRLARPLDFSNESQTCPRMLARARQHGSTTIDEYIGTICLAATLRKKPHLSFHRKLSLKLSCFHPPSERAHSLPLARFRRLFLGPLVLRLNCLSFESLPDGKQNPRVYSAGPTEALCTFPFLSHPRRGCCRLFLRAAVVSIGGGVEWESAAFHSANIFVFSLEMESEQQCPESVSQRLAFGTDVSGCSTPDPVVFEKRVPSRLRESRIIFRCFRLARPLDFSNESQTCQRMLSRAIQHGSTTVDEYIGTICLAATLRKKPHLSFHRKLSLKLSCFHPPSERAHSLPLARFRRLFLGPLVLRLNCLSSESPLDGKQNPRVYSAGPTEALCTFPFLSHPRRGCCRLFLRASVVSIGGGVEWESAAFHSANIFVFSLKMESEQQCPESVSQRLAFGTDVSGQIGYKSLYQLEIIFS